MRTLKEQTIDQILLLFLFSLGNEYGDMRGNLKHQKLVFIVEKELIDNKIRAVHFKFFSYTLGPYSKELAEDIKALIKNGFITSCGKLTKRGCSLLSQCKERLFNINKNGDIAHLISQNVKNYARFDGEKLKSIVYSLKVNPHDLPHQELKVKDIPMFYDIFVPELITDFNLSFILPEEDTESLYLSLTTSPQEWERMRRPAILNSRYCYESPPL